ncbi:MAG: hypothetical protein DMG32_01265 [Acidobacteria bacterium]|nr:MAG: hypothetical protein DMG32_01265 [Acidobacteriota bacterium]
MSSQATFMKISPHDGSVLFLAVLFCFSQTNAAIAQPTGSSGKDPTTRAFLAKPGRSSSSSSTRKKADLWFPRDKDIDWVIPAVTPGAACPLADVLSEAGKRTEELVRNVHKFTATEVVEHQKVDRSGRLRPPEIRRFNYLVSIAQASSGYMSVEEYRKGGSNTDQFPDDIATVGTPSLVLIFHPHHVQNFQMTCEGLGEWRGQPAWQVRFEERRNCRNSMSVMDIAGSSFSVRMRGRAWILADSYQVARLESDLADEIPQIRLRLQHQDIEYRPVPVPESKGEIWLPSSTELYMDFRGHRFYRRHSFTDLKFFSVNVRLIGDPKE